MKPLLENKLCKVRNTKTIRGFKDSQFINQVMKKEVLNENRLHRGSVHTKLLVYVSQNEL